MTDVLEGAPPITRQEDRRLYARQAVRFGYLDLPAGSSATLLDIGEGGLAIQSFFRALEGDFSSVRFRFSELEPWLEAQSRLAWISKSQKLAGVEFIELSPAGRAQIQIWIDQEARAGETAAGTAASPFFLTKSLDTGGSSATSEVLRFAPEMLNRSSRSWSRWLGVSAFVLAVVSAALFAVRLGWTKSEIGTRPNAAPPARVQTEQPSGPQGQASGQTTISNRPRNAQKTATAPAPQGSSASGIQRRTAKSSGTFTLQVAALRNKQNAESLIASIRSKGLPVSLAHPGGSDLFIVTAGPFADRASADDGIQSLKQLGFDAVLHHQAAE